MVNFNGEYDIKLTHSFFSLGFGLTHTVYKERDVLSDSGWGNIGKNRKKQIRKCLGGTVPSV